jgi:hypothetical protein
MPHRVIATELVKWFRRTERLAKPENTSRTGVFRFLIPPDLTTERLSPSVTADGKGRPSFEQDERRPQRASQSDELPHDGGPCHGRTRITANDARPDLREGCQMPQLFGGGGFSSYPRKIILQVHIVEEAGKQ